MSIFTKVAMNALMNNSHPQIDRKQCWNLHPHKEQCTDCKDICPYGEEIFSRPNLVKDWDPCIDCGPVRIGLPHPVHCAFHRAGPARPGPHRLGQRHHLDRLRTEQPPQTTWCGPAWAP